MDFLWNGYGFMITKNMNYGIDMNLLLNPFAPTAHDQQNLQLSIVVFKNSYFSLIYTNVISLVVTKLYLLSKC